MRSLLCLWVAAAAAPQAIAGSGDVIRVGLWKEASAPVRVKVSGATMAGGGAGRVWKVSAEGGRLRVEPAGRTAGRVSLRGAPQMTVSGGASTVTAPGELVLSARNGRLNGILILPLEEYVARVVAREMPQDWPEEALAAQAVAARSFALASRRRHAREGFDVCSLTHCQLWSPSPPPARAIQAARSTEGWILTAAGQPLRAPYSSTCGGHTADGAPVGLPVACAAVRDGPPGREFCRASPHFRWQARLSPRELGRMAGLPAGWTPEITVLARDRSGRVTRARLGTTELDGGALLMRAGRTLGWAEVKSCLFTLRREGDHTVLDGRGLGHGAGLCQWGARGRALQGQNCKQILKAYFPKARLERR